MAMTPKEKAEELFNKFFTPSTQKDLITRSHAKQCALIAVDEILNNFGLRVNGKQHYCGQYTLEFYREVRNEIETL